MEFINDALVWVGLFLLWQKIKGVIRGADKQLNRLIQEQEDLKEKIDIYVDELSEFRQEFFVFKLDIDRQLWSKEDRPPRNLSDDFWKDFKKYCKQQGGKTSDDLYWDYVRAITEDYEKEQKQSETENASTEEKTEAKIEPDLQE